MSYRERVYLVLGSYAAINVALVFMCAKGMLGQGPWALLYGLFAVSVLGALLATPFFFLTRGWGLRAVDVVVFEATFIGLAWSTVWLVASSPI